MEALSLPLGLDMGVSVPAGQVKPGACVYLECIYFTSLQAVSGVCSHVPILRVWLWLDRSLKIIELLNHGLGWAGEPQNGFGCKGP